MSWTSLFDVTEMDDAFLGKNVETIKADLADIARKYYRGEETYGVLQGYIDAALAAGVTATGIACIVAEAKEKRGNV